MEAGHVPELIEANIFNPEDYNHGHQVRQVDGEFDLFGDGTAGAKIAGILASAEFRIQKRLAYA